MKMTCLFRQESVILSIIYCSQFFWLLSLDMKLHKEVLGHHSFAVKEYKQPPAKLSYNSICKQVQAKPCQARTNESARTVLRPPMGEEQIYSTVSAVIMAKANPNVKCLYWRLPASLQSDWHLNQHCNFVTEFLIKMYIKWRCFKFKLMNYCFVANLLRNCHLKFRKKE